MEINMVCGISGQFDDCISIYSAAVAHFLVVYPTEAWYFYGHRWHSLTICAAISRLLIAQLLQ